jgi:hypothetical protein
VEKFDMSDVAPTLIGFALTLIGFAMSYFFHRKATAELRKEAKKLRKLHELTLYGLFNRDAKLEPRYDADGNIVGIIVSGVGRP